MHLPVVNISVIYIAIESGSLVKLTRSTGWCGELQPILPYHWARQTGHDKDLYVKHRERAVSWRYTFIWSQEFKPGILSSKFVLFWLKSPNTVMQ